jgi:hypothetical protein
LALTLNPEQVAVGFDAVIHQSKPMKIFRIRQKDGVAATEAK